MKAAPQAIAMLLVLALVAFIVWDIGRRDDEFRVECAKRGGRPVVTRNAKMCFAPEMMR